MIQVPNQWTLNKGDYPAWCGWAWLSQLKGLQSPTEAPQRRRKATVVCSLSLPFWMACSRDFWLAYPAPTTTSASSMQYISPYVCLRGSISLVECWLAGANQKTKDCIMIHGADNWWAGGPVSGPAAAAASRADIEPYRKPTPILKPSVLVPRGPSPILSPLDLGSFLESLLC